MLTEYVSLVSKNILLLTIFNLTLVHRKQCMWTEELFFKMLKYSLAKKSIDIIAQDLNYDLLNMTEEKLLDIFTDQI